MSEATNVITTRTMRCWLEGDGIVRAAALPDMEQTLEDAKANVAATQRISGGTRRPVLIDLSGLHAIDAGARRYYGGEEAARVMLAAALCVDSPLSRMIASFFMGLNGPRYPMRMFSSEASAIAWLEDFLR